MTRARDLADSADKDISGTLTLDDIVLSNDLTIADNGKAIFGAGSDLQIYHDGNSKITDVGSGKLELHSDGTGVTIQKGATEYMAQFLTDGAVQLYHDNSQKFATTSTGIDVTGTVTSSGSLTINTGSSSLPAINLSHSNANGDNFQITGGIPGLANSGFTIRDVDASANRLVIDSSGNVGIGGTPASTFHVSGDNPRARFTDTPNSVNFDIFMDDDGAIIGMQTNHVLKFMTNDAERMRLTSTGLGIGTSSPSEKLVLANSSNEIKFGLDGSSHDIFSNGKTFNIGTTDDTVVRMFQNNSEVMRLSGGNLLIGTTSQIIGTHNHTLGVSASGVETPISTDVNATVDRYAIDFHNPNGRVGFILTSGSSTTYSTSSDYRLKENVVELTGATDRIKQLEPKRFNFIADADTTVDGFLAHEVQSVVPEAITGTKDEVEVWADGDELPDGVSVGENKLDDDGKTIPKMQGIDQAKLVPLLTAALREAIAKIETLEARITALEGA